MTKIAVLSRYKEDNHSWYNIVKNKYDNVIVFNKDHGDNLLPNIGRESHTYIYYILNNYDNLPEEILFSQYDPTDHFHKPDPHNTRDLGHINNFLNSYLYDLICIRPTDYDLYVRKRKIDWLNFYNKLYDKIVDVDRIVSTGACLNGIFRVSKEAVLRHDIYFYQRALDMLSVARNPHEGFFFERAWKYIFSNYGNCPEKYTNFSNSIWLFGNPQNRGITLDRKDKAYGHIKFYSDGSISGRGYSYYGNSNESHWSIYDDILYIFSCTGSVTSTYKLLDNINNISEIKGDYYDSNGMIHKNILFLRKAMWIY